MEKSGEKKVIEVVCPNCGGVTKVMNGGSFPVYMCHVGHTFSELSFCAALAECTEGKLWEAYRTLVENKTFYEMCCERAVKGDDSERAETCRTRARLLDAHARELRRLIEDIIFDTATCEKNMNQP